VPLQILPQQHLIPVFLATDVVGELMTGSTLIPSAVGLFELA
jgi:hypothetical protein